MGKMDNVKHDANVTEIKSSNKYYMVSNYDSNYIYFFLLPITVSINSTQRQKVCCIFSGKFGAFLYS